jgi:hypothetical protein
MATNGDRTKFAARFPDVLVPRILKLVLESWKTFELPGNRREVPITKKFCVHLRSRKDRSGDFFRIDCEVTLLDSVGEDTGRIDLMFSRGYDENVYFSLECKRLRVNQLSGFRSLAGEYVSEGMLRYFNGQYATGLDKGGMLGYVMDGDIEGAIADVGRAIENRRAELYMSEDEILRGSSCVSSRQVRETCHMYGDRGVFIVHHVFVDCGGCKQ